MDSVGWGTTYRRVSKYLATDIKVATSTFLH